MNSTKVRLTAAQHASLRAHLFPGDGKEAVALALCGRSSSLGAELLVLHRLFPIEHEACDRGPQHITWPAIRIEPLLLEAVAKGFAIIKIHSHPNGFDGFSLVDDRSDRLLFDSIFGWLDSDRPHASAVMLPDGRIRARTVDPDGSFEPIESVVVVGDDVVLWRNEEPIEGVPAFAESHAQLFGAGTTTLLRQLRFGVVGCSGTGSLVIEQLARLGAGEIVVVDPDIVEARNLNRIIGATTRDAAAETAKVDVMKRSIESIGLGTVVHGFQKEVDEPEVIRALALCDFLLGCVDSLVGRHRMGLISRYYVLPYVDVGVKLEALADGTINQVAGSVHYMRPDGLDLMDRGMFSAEDLRAEELYRTDRRAYDEQRGRGYVRGVAVRRPAVISVNMKAAGLAVTEMLARLHPFRIDENAEFATTRFSLSHGHWLLERADGEPSPRALRRVGRGDASPMLDLPALRVG